MGKPEALFQSGAYASLVRSRFSFTHDGERVLMLRSMSRDAVAPTTVVLNGQATLRR